MLPLKLMAVTLKSVLETFLSLAASWWAVTTLYTAVEMTLRTTSLEILNAGAECSVVYL